MSLNEGETGRRVPEGFGGLGPYLMQFSGSFLQSVLHLNLSQLSHPIGGVLARPFSRAEAAAAASSKHSRVLTDILLSAAKIKWAQFVVGIVKGEKIWSFKSSCAANSHHFVCASENKL